VTTPNFSFQRRYAHLYRLRRTRLDFAAHDHVGHFTPAALQRLLEVEGLANVQFHFRGITETCVLADSSRARGAIMAKRAWNHAAFAARRMKGLPTLVSELQATARLVLASEGATAAEHGAEGQRKNP
jgi:hypothetical protein